MAVATQAARAQREVKTYIFNWEGVDKNNRTMRGDMRAASETVVTSSLRRQGIRVTRVKRLSLRGGGRIKDRDITFFTRQLSTMMKAGVPLLQAFDIVARGHSNARFSRVPGSVRSTATSRRCWVRPIFRWATSSLRTNSSRVASRLCARPAIVTLSGGRCGLSDV